MFLYITQIFNMCDGNKNDTVFIKNVNENVHLSN